MKRIIFITDIHSSYTKFINLLEESNYNEDTDILVLGGDYFDRGKETVLMAKWLVANYKKPNIHLIRGNHDDFMIDLFAGRNELYEFNYKNNGLKKTIQDFIYPQNFYDPLRAASIIRQKLPELPEVFSGLKNYVELDGYIFTHGGLPENFRENASESDWANARWEHSVKWAKSNPYPNEKHIFIGHYGVLHIPHPFGLKGDEYEPVTINNITFCDGGLSSEQHDGLVVTVEL